jgi:hypothetical protein
MEKNSNKDWMDAVREQCFSDEAMPASGGWEAVGAKMLRAAARRRAILAAAIALPALALLLWSPWQQASTAPSSPKNGVVLIGELQTRVQSTTDPSSAGLPLRANENYFSGDSPKNQFPLRPPQRPRTTGESTPALPDHPDGTPLFSDDTSIIPDVVSVASDASAAVPDTVSVIPDLIGDPVSSEPQSPLLALDEPSLRKRPRVSIGLRAGTGPPRREASVSMQSEPYIAALNFLNTVDPSMMPGVKSSTSNTREIGYLANSFFSASSSGQYTHDLPLSLGLSVRVALTPRLGLESGLEYTYLHSVEDFVGNRLNQRLHFIGIPVRLEASLWERNAFGIYAGIGGKMEKCISASLGRVACEEPRMQWSAEAFGGIQLRLHPRMQLYFQPALSWYITKTDLVTYRTEHPLGFTLHAGLRFDL